MESIWQVGSFIIHKEWVVIAAALVIAAGCITFLRYTPKEKRKGYHESLGNVLLVFIVVYQLSSFLFQYSLAIHYPIAVLASPGTWKEWGVAWAAGGIYTALTARKNNQSFYELSLYFFLVYVLTEIFYLVYQVYNQVADPALSVHLSIMSAVFFIYLLLRYVWSDGPILFMLMLHYGVAMSLYSLVFPATMLFLYIPVWVFAAVFATASVGWIIYWFQRGSGKRGNR